MDKSRDYRTFNIVISFSRDPFYNPFLIFTALDASQRFFLQIVSGLLFLANFVRFRLLLFQTFFLSSQHILSPHHLDFFGFKNVTKNTNLYLDSSGISSVSIFWIALGR